ncbi:MAG: hypothetical protein JXK07_00145 [Spirochaetes bacterium]|nr:hypothetical protein [Spirochaetota bacterium]
MTSYEKTSYQLTVFALARESKYSRGGDLIRSKIYKKSETVAEAAVFLYLDCRFGGYPENVRRIL